MLYKAGNSVIKFLGSLHELLLLSVPDKLLAGRNAGLVKSRDFNQVAAAYTAGSVKKVSGAADVIY